MNSAKHLNKKYANKKNSSRKLKRKEYFPTSYEASINLIPKPGKKLQENYRPVPFMNVGTNIPNKLKMESNNVQKNTISWPSGVHPRNAILVHH